jgi:amino acid adenylation domain-containing protein
MVSRLQISETEAVPQRSVTDAVSLQRVNGPAPLSFVQERRWFLEQMRPNNPPNIVRAIRLRGPLDPEKLQRAVEGVVERHEILRTTLSEVKGERVQVVGANSAVRISDTDLKSLTETEQEIEIQRIVNEESVRLFDLTNDPFIRTLLIQIDSRDHLLLLTAHRGAFDDVSFGIFYRDLAALYQDESDGNSSRLPELVRQYRDFAEWERSEQNVAWFEEQISYWKSQLEDYSPAELLTDRSRPAIQTFAGRQRFTEINGQLLSDLNSLCAREQVSVYVALLSAFCSLMHFYTGSDDVVIGGACDARPPRFEELIGCFISFVCLRTRLTSETTGSDLLSQVDSVFATANANRDVPFAKVVDELHPGRDVSRTPIFQVVFAAEETEVQRITANELTFVPEPIYAGTADFDLTVKVRQTKERVIVSWEYNRDLFEDATIARMMNHYVRALENLVAKPEDRLCTWDYLTRKERHQLLYEWNNTGTEYPNEKCVHQLFEDQAGRTPDAVALIVGDRRISYGELNERSNQLANYLVTREIGPEVRVGILMQRTEEMLIAMIGVLKAGGCYVPLDALYPEERIRFLLNDSSARLVVTERELLSKLDRISCESFAIEDKSHEIREQSLSNPRTTANTENLAYIIYTSGSTGQPKGVAIEHQSAVAFLSWAINTFDQEQLSGVLASSSSCFDLSIFEIFAPLSAGGKIILADNALSLMNLPAASQVTLLNTVPSVMTELLRVSALPKSVRTINLAGEPLKPALVEQILNLGTVHQVFDLYGPSEDTTYSTFTLRDSGCATIGRPIANTQVYIVDRYLRPVPVGVPGELCLSGKGLARGYLNRPDLTAEKFVANPFSGAQKARMYRTGDLARYLAGGKIEYLGRIDNQVKIRGYRIELDEIEARLAKHAEVNDCAVVVTEDHVGDKQVVAYVVVSGRLETRANDLREFLKIHLPDYMIPSLFVPVNKLPLNRNGKLDKKALPNPFSATRPSGPALHTDQIEDTLTAIWEEVLGIENICATDNFFDLGGHSLKAIRMFAEIEKNFGKSIPLATLFRSPTIEKLATILRQDGWSPPESSVVAIQPHGSRPPFFCVHAKGGNVLFYRELARRLGDDQPFYGIQPRRLGGRQVVHATVEEMAEYYIQQMRTVQPVGPYFIGGASFGGVVAFEMARQLKSNGQQVGLVALIDSGTPDYGVTSNSVLGRRLHRLRARTNHHRAKVGALGGVRPKAAYIMQRLAAYFALVRRRVRFRYRRVGGELYSIIGQPLPEHFIQIENRILDVQRRYKPQDYDGDIVVFRANIQPDSIEADPTLGWRSFVKGKLETHEAAGDHNSILQEPFVNDLATKLASCLQIAAAGTHLIERATADSDVADASRPTAFDTTVAAAQAEALSR